jgi:hypothetical protein
MPIQLNSLAGLWLPTNRQRQTAQVPTQGFMQFVHIALSYKDLYGETPSWEQLERVLEPY